MHVFQSKLHKSNSERRKKEERRRKKHTVAEKRKFFLFLGLKMVKKYPDILGCALFKALSLCDEPKTFEPKPNFIYKN